MRRTTFVAAVGAAIAVGPTAVASFIPLDLRDTPDILSGFIDVSYIAASDAFSAQGFALSLDHGGGPAKNISNGFFEIAATIDDSGAAVTGVVEIGGGLPGLGPTLLMGSLLAFGFDSAGGMLLEFLFEVTGGDLASDFGGPGAQFGVLMNMGGGGYSGDFSEDFDNLIGGLPGTGMGFGDTAPLVPGPAVLAALLGGVLLPRRGRAGRLQSLETR